MKANFLITLIYINLIPAIICSQPNTLPIDASHSVISFSVGFAGDITKIEGRFDSFEGEVGYNNQNDQSSFYANIVIDVNSLKTGDTQRDTDLMGAEYFNSDTYPSIIFNSKSTRKTSTGYILNGELQMLGVNKELNIPFEFTHQEPFAWVFGEPRIAATGNITLSRSEFSFPKRGWNSVIPSLGSMMLNDNVEIRLTIQGVGEGLSTIILNEIENNGIEAGLDLYNGMKKESGLQITYNFDVSTLAEIGMTLIRNDKTQHSIKVGNLAVQEEPENFFGYYILGMSFKANGETEKAIMNLKKVLELNPNLYDRINPTLEELKSQ